MLHKATHVKARSVPRSPNARLSVIVTAVTLAVAESRTTRTDASCSGTGIAALHRDDGVTLRFVTGAAWWNAWLVIAQTDILVWRSSRHARVAIYNHRRGAIGDQVTVAKVVVTSNQSVVAFNTVLTRKPLVGICKVADSQSCLIEINGCSQWMPVLKWQGIHLGVTSNRFTWSFIWKEIQNTELFSWKSAGLPSENGGITSTHSGSRFLYQNVQSKSNNFLGHKRAN